MFERGWSDCYSAFYHSAADGTEHNLDVIATNCTEDRDVFEVELKRPDRKAPPLCEEGQQACRIESKHVGRNYDHN